MATERLTPPLTHPQKLSGSDNASKPVRRTQPPQPQASPQSPQPWLFRPNTSPLPVYDAGRAEQELGELPIRAGCGGAQ
eukprot:CAMPEP_0118880210 /NCGR_PEP_ID=MMETSP1163-20130328/19812_1 /TAXON_ID=124430 /ORGANISM="Phaeomonas parva, Strain CCMP2877" /LENGTH=78 /DNA_ID=CAMNT_0006816543 /DNA_START=105 /DNA_END=338 /DNA_ORIENTATION=+